MIKEYKTGGGLNPLGLIGMAANVLSGGSLTPILAAAGMINGIARGDYLGAGLSALGGATSGAFGSGIQNGVNNMFGITGANAASAANTAKDVTFNMPTTADYAASLTTGQMPTITANMGNTASNIANASKGFNGTDLLKLGMYGLGSAGQKQTQVAGGGQQPITNGTNHLQAYTNSLSKKANEFD